MQLTDIKTMLAAIKLPVTYYQWPESEAPALPYLVWYLPGSGNVAADDSVYKRIEALNLELYTADKDFETEAAVEAVLDANHIVWTRSEAYLETEHMYEVLFEMEIIIDG